MNKKNKKYFYISDIVIVVLSAIGLIVIENNKEFGLSALEGTGKIYHTWNNIFKQFISTDNSFYYIFY
ncbi:MAG: hypothetical protein L6V81_00950 [Clostridium sp.]|nr:MAG: hypothetical protein L6V81_00950 [Clostridium sp.]